MVKTKKNTQPQPQPTTGDVAEVMPSTNVIQHPRSALLEKRLKEIAEHHQPSDKLMSEARQKLAEAADLFALGDKEAKEAWDTASRAAILLYKARAAKAIGPEQLSAVLGDAFGWRLKGTTDRFTGAKGEEQSKTPFGQGEAIRKRIVRAVQAREYVTGETESAFFKDLPKDDIRTILQGMENETVGFWIAYERFADVRKEHKLPSLNPVLDPRRVADFAKALQADGIAKAISESPALDAAYVALYGCLVECYREIEDLRKTEAA